MTPPVVTPRARPRQRPAVVHVRAHDRSPSVARATAPTAPHAVALEANEETPALWHGAWVGWLACQTALLVMVESTPIGSHASLAVGLRAAVLGLFVLGFRKPCFPSALGRVAFAWCVVAAETAVAAVCSRWPVVAGWPLVTAMVLPLLAGHPSVSGLFTFNGTLVLTVLEACYALLASTSRAVAAVGPALFPRDPNTVGARVWGRCLDGVEQSRRACAHAVNRRRSVSHATRH